MAKENENLQDTPKDELKKQIEGQVTPPAEPEAETKEPAPEAEEKQEDLILGKFKSQDDLIKSYQELEKRSTKAEQTRKQYRELMEPYVEFDEDGNVIGIKTQPTTRTTEDKPESDIWKGWEDRYIQLEAQYGPTRAQLMINAEMAGAITQKATAPVDDLRANQQIDLQKKRVRANKADFSDYEDEIDKYLSKMDIKSKTNPNAVETVYYIVKGKKAEELVKTSEEESALKTAAIEEQKQKAQVEKQTKTPEEPKKDIDSLSSKEMAAHFKFKRVER